MKNIYSKTQLIPSIVLSAILLLVLSTNATAQVEKVFTQRTSTYAQPDYIKPNTNGQIYNLRGDFRMAGNTNLTLTNYSNNGSNSDDMSYVDIDLDGTTINSSSSFLDITNDACTEIVYAGLYWSGRANTGAMSFNVSGQVQTPGTTTTQTLNHTHNGTNNLNNTTVTINRSGSLNNYYPVQTVVIGDKEFEFTINNNGTISKRERVNNGTWSGSVVVAISNTNSSNVSTTTSNPNWNRDTSLDNQVDVGSTRYCYRGYSRTVTETTDGSKIFTVSSPIVYNYSGVNYTITQLASYFTSVRTRTEERYTRRTRTTSQDCDGNNSSYDTNNGNYYNVSQGTWSAMVYNGTEANFITATNNYVTIQGPKSSTGTTNYNGTLTKNIVKFKKEGGTYQTITANTTDIRYPNGVNGNMYAAYADVTEYVRANKGGNYFVADLATTAGTSDNTGHFGGWGLVVIYANPNMKWRDITVFDGYAYVAGNTTVNHQLPISGFTAAQSGLINVDIGVMAGEGDRSISGDYFQVLGRGGDASVANNYKNLGNSGSTGGFFNSNIDTGSTKNPNLVNNTGIDIQRIALPNQTSVYTGQTGTSNYIIGNSATSTTFKYGSTQDTYIIYSLVFAVDAYIPEVEGVNSVLTSQTTADINNLQPGDEVTYTFDVYNYGSDFINNAKVDIDIPNAMKLVSYSMQPNTQAASGAQAPFSFSQPEWVNPSTNVAANVQPATLDGGILRWTLGTIPTQTVVSNIANRVPMATLTYKLKVTNDCTILKTSVDECAIKPTINGTITGTGNNSGENLSTEFIKGYNTDCNNTPIYGGIDMQINPSQAFLTQCSLDEPIQGETRIFKKFCSVANNEILRSEIVAAYIGGTKFYSTLPTDPNPVEVTGNFPVNSDGSQRMFYAVLPGANQACFYQLATQLDVITQTPTISNVDVCFEVAYILNPTATGQDPSTSFYYFTNGSTTPLTAAPQPTKPGVYTYQVALGKVQGTSSCFGPKSTFTITIRNCKTPVNPMIYTPLNR